MKNLPRLLILSAAVLSGCNLTYDRDGLEFDGVPECSAPLSACAGVTACVDLGNDPAHCGFCGNVCEAGTAGTCTNGYCDTCESIGTSTCNVLGVDYCADLTSDPDHCGFCGNVCGAGTAGTCTDGYCNLACDASTPDLCGTGATQYCTDFGTDPNNCNGCGNVCPSGNCSAAMCVPVVSCTAPEVTCNVGAGDYCANLQVDALDCGSCGNSCGTLACEAGFCHVACSGTGVLECFTSGVGYSCVDALNDPAHCGSCATTTCTSCVDGVCDPGTATLAAVAPYRPINGARWNDWVEGLDYTSAVDAPCLPATSATCVHAGELRAVKLPSLPSCAGVTGRDEFDWFSWSCTIDPLDGMVTLVSVRLSAASTAIGAPEVRLADLIDAPVLQWRLNRVTVYTDSGATVLGATPWTVWWPDNLLAPVPLTGQLNQAGTIYLWDTGSPPVPLEIAADRVGLVVVRGAVHSQPNTSANSVTVFGDPTMSQTRDFLWIEGAFDATASLDGLRLTSVRRSTLRSLDVDRQWLSTMGDGIRLGLSSGNRIRIVRSRRSNGGLVLVESPENNLRGIETSNCWTGIDVMANSDRNELRLVSTAANVNDGIVLHFSKENEIDGLVSSNNGGVGLRLYNEQRARLTHVVATHNARGGVSLEWVTDSRLVGVTAAGNGLYLGDPGLRLNDSSANVVLNAAIYRAPTGIVVESSQQNTLAELAVGDVSGPALAASGTSSNNLFTGHVLVGVTGPLACDDGGLANAGFDSNCLATPPSDFTLESVGTLADSFVPDTLLTTDAVNETWAGTPVSFTDLDALWMDWTGFENEYRAWGPTVAGSLGCSNSVERNQSVCTGLWIGLAGLFDWSLRVGAPLHGRFTLAAAIGASVTHTWSDSTTVAFLRHAIDRDITTVGNGDGLCEAGELCVFSPNFGAYQGHGSLLPAGLYPVGTGTASIYQWAPNGY